MLKYYANHISQSLFHVLQSLNAFLPSPLPKCPSSALIFVETMRLHGSGRSGFCCQRAV